MNEPKEREYRFLEKLVNEFQSENNALKETLDKTTGLVVDYQKRLIKLEVTRAELLTALHDIYEEYAGMGGFISKTAPEGYCQRIIKNMADIASEALKEKESK